MKSCSLRLTFAALSAVTALTGAACKSGGDTGSTGSASSSGGGGGDVVLPAWAASADILVSGETASSDDCRNDVCRHNENTDLTVFQGAIWLVHRTAESQVLGPNSSLRISRSADGGKTFQLQAKIQAPTTPTPRDIRDPHFYQVGGKLFIKTLTRLPVNSTRDSNVETIAMMSSSADGITWSALTPIGPAEWSFWRIKEQDGTYYTAAYHDGDTSVSIYSSTDGVAWTKGAQVYGTSADTPLETELTFMPSGKLLALVRMDGTDAEILGSQGRLRTKICWADKPYATFSCPDEFDGQRLDGPISFFHGARLFVIARRHLGADVRKRTALFEITGDFNNGGKLAIQSLGDFPSAGDTSYAGVAPIDEGHSLVSWYAGNLDLDQAWTFGMFNVTDIWQGVIDFSKL